MKLDAMKLLALLLRLLAVNVSAVLASGLNAGDTWFGVGSFNDEGQDFR